MSMVKGVASDIAVGIVMCVLALSAGLPVPAHAADDSRPVILAIGESTTAGYGVPADHAWPAQLQQLLDDQGYAYRVVNHGRSGSTTAMALATMDRGLALLPHIVLIAIGGNDAGNRVAVVRTEQNLRTLVAIFVRAGATVYLAERTPASDGGNAQATALYATVAQEEGALLMPSLRQDIAGHPELLISDMRHPNAAGYAIVAQRIFTLLQPQLVKQE